jgi:hypothetical protein
MKSKINRFILVLIIVLSVILLSTASLAQTDVNINNRNIVRVGDDITIAPKQVVENVHAIGGDVIIQEGARVTKTAIAIDGDVILQKNARVDGDAYAVGGKVITEEGATITGASSRVSGWGMHGSRTRGMNSFFVRYCFGSAFHLVKVIFGAILGIFMINLRPHFLPQLANTLKQYPLQSGLWGLGGSLAIITLVIFLAISIIGIPLLPLVGLVSYVAMIFGTLGVALWLGENFVTASDRPLIQQFLTGMLIFAFIGLIPIFGGLMVSVVNIFGLGVLLLWLLNKKYGMRMLEN